MNRSGLRPNPHFAPCAARLGSTLLLLTLALGSAVHADGTGPADAKGATTVPLSSIDLAAEIDGLSGWQLRARLVTIAPGGHVAVHSHKGRPTMEYVVQGNVVEIRNGVEIAHRAGDMVPAAHDVTHWWENRGTTPVILLPVDIFKP